MKTLLCIFALMTLASCSYFETKVIPKAKEAASKSISKAIVAEGECVHPEAVKASVDKLLKIESDESMVVVAIAQTEEVAPVQELAPSSKLSVQLCKGAFGLAVPALLSKGVPVEWGCRLTNLSAKIDVLASKACEKL